MRSPSDGPVDRHPDWQHLLINAVNQPGIISAAYSRFWNYSVGNQILAMFQCLERRIEAGPIHTFRGWQDLGRRVKRGEKALILCMPVTVRRKLDGQKIDPSEVRVGDGAERQTAGGMAATDADATASVTVFAYKARWFVLSQTQGTEYVPTILPDWDERQALHGLIINRVPFKHPNGNCQGYALNRAIAVSPIAALPHKTLFHELAHVVLGHTDEGSTLDDHDLTPSNLREVEAECVAMICCESLNLAGIQESRGYIQNWLGDGVIPERSAQRIFKAADSILRAGRAESVVSDVPTPAKP
jgi:N-terminal domain of anti-restriction factor ArdC